MKQNKNYLIIPLTDIKLKDKTNINNIFRNNLRKEHHYIILKITNLGLVKNSYATELLTHEVFHFNAPLIKIILNPNSNELITAESTKAIIATHPKLITINEVKEFYKDIINNNEASEYTKLVKEVLLEKKLFKVKSKTR